MGSGSSCSQGSLDDGPREGGTHILPEQKHQPLNKVSKVVVPRYLCIWRECDIPEYLMHGRY